MLVINYLPEVQRGACWATASTSPPSDGFRSNNEYLNLTLTQDYLGLGIFTLLILFTCGRMIGTIVSSTDRKAGPPAAQPRPQFARRYGQQHRRQNRVCVLQVSLISAQLTLWRMRSTLLYHRKHHGLSSLGARFLK
jgi:hypothetical protein